MDYVRTALEQQPLMALFVTIAIGYLVGELNIRGFSLGVGAVLFVALGIGWIAPKSAPGAVIGNFGLALFLYTVGIHYGRHFFIGLTSVDGLKANLIALIGVFLAGAVTLALIKLAHVDAGHALGLFAGAGTSTATLQAAMTALKSDDPSVGYSVAYPFGVAGPILLLYLTFSIFKPRVDEAAAAALELLEIELQRPEHFGRRLEELNTALPPDVRIVALRRGERNQPTSPDTVLAERDILLAVGPTKGVLERARKELGDAAIGQITHDRRHLDYLRVFASRPVVVGRALSDLQMPGKSPAVIAEVRRGDADVQPRPDLVLEFGDRVGLLADRADFSSIRKFFGDSIKGTAEFSYISIGIGMALGILVGAISVPIPGVGTISFGLCGVLIVALFLGNQRRTAGLNWMLPLSANLVLRNLGLTVFLAQAGMSSGPKFAAAVAETGLLMLGLGAAILVALILPVFVLGFFVLRMSFDDLSGIIAGVTGNAAILAYANRLTPTDKPDVRYAMIFPGMTIVKILFVSVASAFL